ncbi:MAG: hypothetical protein H7Y00_11180, partial [Fimbriimonadaceae bacterium]|nr:hypothetical protein [Chitinophagales bacterium]
MKRINKILSLMIISGSLLTLFILRWLQSEYTAEKMELQKDLLDQFVSARERVTDSLITKNLINPILNNPKGFKIETVTEDSYSIENDSIKIVRKFSTDDSLPHDVLITGDSSLPGNMKFTVRMEEDSSDILYHGVKMFITEMKGPHGERDFFEKYMQASDTVM